MMGSFTARHIPTPAGDRTPTPNVVVGGQRAVEFQL